MTKRILTAAVCLCLCLALSACGAPGDNGPAADTAKKSLKEKAQAAVEDIADLTQMPFEDLQDMTGSGFCCDLRGLLPDLVRMCLQFLSRFDQP